jgi:polyisoprenoid-binding protein YceI
MTTETTTSALAAGEWTIDPTHSEVGFTVRHLGLSKVRGRFSTFEGTLTIGEDQLASSVKAAIDLSSIDTNNEQRDGHLQSADFFGVEANPTMTFESTEVSEHSLSGNLSVNGVTKPVVLDLEFHGVTTDPYGATRSGFSASGQILRSEFGISFNAPAGLDGMLVSDKVTIELEIEALPAV